MRAPSYRAQSPVGRTSFPRRARTRPSLVALNLNRRVHALTRETSSVVRSGRSTASSTRAATSCKPSPTSHSSAPPSTSTVTPMTTHLADALSARQHRTRSLPDPPTASHGRPIRTPKAAAVERSQGSASAPTSLPQCRRGGHGLVAAASAGGLLEAEADADAAETGEAPQPSWEQLREASRRECFARGDASDVAPPLRRCARYGASRPARLHAGCVEMAFHPDENAESAGYSPRWSPRWRARCTR